MEQLILLRTHHEYSWDYGQGTGYRGSAVIHSIKKSAAPISHTAKPGRAAPELSKPRHIAPTNDRRNPTNPTRIKNSHMALVVKDEE
jgi:hypothetical protein